MSKAELLANLYSANGPIGGGTAGGLLYLDGSKTLTTGSALQFDGTNLGLGGNLGFSGTGNRITGDFSNATIANRVMFQTSTANGSTSIYAIPNGTATVSGYAAFNSQDVNNASYLNVSADATTTSLDAGKFGTGTFLPMTFYAGGSARVRIDTSGNVGIGTASPTARLHINNQDAANTLPLVVSNNITGTDIASAGIGFDAHGVRFAQIVGGQQTNGTFADGNLGFFTRNAETVAERMRITSAGNVGIGTSSPASVLTIFKTTAAANPIGSSSNSAIRLQVDAGEFNEKAEIQFQAGTVAANTGEVFAAISSLYTTFNAANNAGGALLFSTRQSTAAGGLLERMRIDSSGKLLVGFTASKAFGGQLQSRNVIEAIGTDATTPVTISANDHNALDASPTYSSAVLRKFGASASGNLYFASNIAAAGWAEIGGINVQNGVVFGTNSGVPIVFGSAGVERMRMDTSGNLSSASDQYRTRYYQTGSFIPGSTNWMRLCTLPATNGGQHVEFIFTVPGQHLLMKVKFSKTTSGGFGGGGILEVEQLGSYVYNNYYPFDWRLVDGGTNGPSHIDIRFPYNAGESIGYRINVLHSWSAATTVHATFPLTNLGSGTTGSYYANMGNGAIGWTKQWFKMTGARYAFYDTNLTLSSGQTPPTA